MGLRDKAVKGVAWSGLGTVGSGIISFLITMVLARVLSPSDYGILELLAIFTILSEVFIDSGFSQALIKDKDASKDDTSTVFYFNLLVSLVLYALLYVVSPLISDFYQEESLTNLSRFVFLTIVFYSGSIVQTAIFSKQLDFKSQAIASIVSIVISGIVAIALAFLGYGVWALAWNLVLMSAIKCLVLWLISPWRPNRSFRFSSLKKYFSFGVNLLIQGLIDKFVSNLESLLIGKVYSKADLGYFSQARKLDSYIGRSTTNVIRQVSYPLLAKIDNDPVSLKNGYRKVLSTSMLVFIPVSFFIIAAADNFLVCIFGNQWLPSTPFLRLWCVCGLLVSFYSIFQNVFLVKSKTDCLLKLSLIRQVIRIVVIISFIKVSIIALMWAIVGSTVISAVLYSFFGCKMIKYSIKEIATDINPIFFPAMIAALVVYYIPGVLPFSSVYLVFSCQLLIMTIAFFSISVMIKSPSVKELREMISEYYSRLRSR